MAKRHARGRALACAAALLASAGSASIAQEVIGTETVAPSLGLSGSGPTPEAPPGGRELGPVPLPVPQEDPPADDPGREVWLGLRAQLRSGRNLATVATGARRIAEMHGSHPSGRDALLGAAIALHRLLDPSAAAELYERYAERFPAEAAAPAASAAAVRLFAATAQHDRARAALSRFERNYLRRRPAEAAHLAFVVGAALEGADARAAVEHERHYLLALDGHAPAGERAAARVRLVRLLLGPISAEGSLTQASRARREESDRLLGEATGIYESERTALAADPVQQALALDAIGEARFRSAESLRESALRDPMPAFRGEPTTRLIANWARARFAPWLERRTAAQQQAIDAYVAVARLGPTRWAIAASARVGQLWVDMVDQFSRVPWPADVANDAELSRIYRDSIEARSAPWREQAIEAFERGLTLAGRGRSADPWAALCARQLDRLRGPPGAQAR